MVFCYTVVGHSYLSMYVSGRPKRISVTQPARLIAVACTIDFLVNVFSVSWMLALLELSICIFALLLERGDLVNPTLMFWFWTEQLPASARLGRAHGAGQMGCPARGSFLAVYSVAVGLKHFPNHLKDFKSAEPFKKSND